MKHSTIALRLLTLVAACWLISLANVAQAQETTGTISGQVKDQNGGVVVDARVTMSDPTRGFQQTYQTSEEGIFTATQLPPAFTR